MRNMFIQLLCGNSFSGSQEGSWLQETWNVGPTRWEPTNLSNSSCQRWSSALSSTDFDAYLDEGKSTQWKRLFLQIRYCQETWHKTPYSAELPRWHRFRCSEVHVDHESMSWCTLDSWRGARSLDEHRAGQWDRVGDPMPLDPNRCFDFIFSQLIIISWRMKNWHQNSSMQRHAGCGNMSCERQRWQMCTLKIHHLWISVDTSLSPELEELVGSYRRGPSSELVSSESHRWMQASQWMVSLLTGYFLWLIVSSTRKTFLGDARWSS